MKSFISIFFGKIKKWSSPKFVRQALEIRRLSRYPRFKRGETTLLGKKMIFSDGASFVQSYHEIFEQQVYFFETDKMDPVIVDCGSNIGLSIIFYKMLFPKAQIIGFEPDPVLFSLLNANITKFGLEVELHQVAVFNTNEPVLFFSQGGSSGHVVDVEEAMACDRVIIKVPSTTLSPFLTRNVDFLKIDIEGAEYRVIKSIENKLHLVRILFVEYHSFKNSNQELDLILGLLQRAGFRYYLYPAIEKPKPFSGDFYSEKMDMQLNIYAIRKEVDYRHPYL
jgi:FkbM family methyltransferase